MKSKKIRRRQQGVARRDLAKRTRSGEDLQVRALVHVASVGVGREIIESGKLEARRCAVFKDKELVYFFALRPAYRLKDGTEKSDKLNYFPCVFVVAPDNLRDPYHVFPFDTGGALAGVFDRKADREVPLEDYELDPSLEAAGRHIRWAFGDVENYLQGDLRPDVLADVPRHETVTWGFVDIAELASSKRNDADLRASAVEIAYDRHVPLQGNVRLVIIPKQYMEDPNGPNQDFITRLNELGLEWKTYDWQPNRAPDDFLHEINDQVMRFYRENGLI